MRLRHLLLAALLVPAAARADEFDGKPELTTQDKAKIEADQDAAHKAIDEKYKDDDSSSARAAKQREYREADQEVLNKKGLSEKDFMWQNAHNSPDERREISHDKDTIEEQRKAEKDAAAKKKDEGPAEPQVVKGFDENHPLDVVGGDADAKPKKPQLDANGNPVPTVEKLNPADDPNAVPGADAAPPAKDLSNTPIKSGGKKSHHRRSSDE